MRSMPYALLWEMLSHGRWSLPGCFLLGNALPLLLYGALSRDGIDPNWHEFVVLQFVFLPLIIFQFAIGIVSAQGPMSRLYTVPISANSIVAWHTFSGAILLGLETAVAAWLYNTLFHVGWPVWPAALLAAAAWSAFQLLLCVSTQQSLTSMCIAGLPGVGLFLWLQSRYGAWFSPPQHYWSEVTASECATLIGVIAVSYFITVLGVNRARCGVGLPSLGIGNWLVRIWDTLTSRSSAELPPFRCAGLAQFWYEWKLKGAALPLVVAVVLLVAGMGWLLETDFLQVTESNLRDLHEGILACGGILSMLAIGAGFFLGMSVSTAGVRQRELTLGDFTSQFESMGHFQSTRPLESMDFAKAILRTAALSGLAAWGLWFAVFVADLFVAWLFPQLPDLVLPPKIGAWYLPLTILGPWIAMANVAVIGLTGRGGVLSLALVSIAISYVVLLILLKEFFSPSVQERVFWTCLAIVSVVIVGAAAWAFVTAFRQRIIGSNGLLAAAITSSGIVVAAIVLSPFQLFWVAYPMIFAFAALVVMPWATAPLAVAWNRHR